ncbi:MAG: amino acid adenylation domain-containing protein [Opitutales bacterium]|nr:amino acid adenylation domain-containing protein [Opitutales bacterium]
MQTAMLVAGIRETPLPLYVQQLTWSFNESIDVSLFKKAWSTVFSRHDTFRHQFKVSASGQMEVSVGKQLRVHIRHLDLSAKAGTERSSYLQSFKRDDFRRGFAGLKYLCRLTLLQLGPSRFQLVWTSHHSLFDGRARLILIQEFQECYRALKEGVRPNLSKAGLYADHLRWIEKKSFSQSKTFWSKYLDGLTEATPLDLGTIEKPKSQSCSIKGTTSALSKDLSAQVKRWSAKSGYSLNLLFQAAWAIYLWRTTGKQVVAFGGTRACRKSSIPGAESTVGIFVNTIPVCVRFDRIKTVRDLLASLKSGWLDMRPHEHSPAELIKEASSLPDREPLFNSLIGFEKYHLEHLVVSPEGKPYRFELHGLTDLPLVIQAYDGKQIDLTASYDSARFSTSAISTILTSLQTISSQLIGSHCARLSTLSLVNKRQSNIIIRHSQGKAQSWSGLSVQARFAEIAQRYPDQIALCQGTEKLSYRELDQYSNQWARFLKKQGVVPGSSVGLFFEREPKLLVVILAVLKAGASYVPFDVEYPKDRLKWMLSDVKPELLLSSVSLSTEMKQLGLNALFYEELEGRVARYSKQPPSVFVDEDSAAYTMYTSGSTGNPKGVVIPHRGITRLVTDTDYVRLNDRTCTLQMAPVSFDASTFEIWAPLLNGGTCVLYPGRMPDIEVLKSQIAVHGINTLWLTASLFNFIVDSDSKSLQGIRQLLVGGEALSPVHIGKAYRALSRIQIINGYGPTENTTFSCCYRIPKDFSARKQVPLGSAIAGSSAYVLDASQQLAPIGVPGELYVGGRGVALGYFNRKKLTASRFLPDPFASSEESLIYATGDKVLLNEAGNFEFLGRQDDQVKIRGHRIEPGEIQAQLVNCPKVKAAFVKAETVRNATMLFAFVVFKRQDTQNISVTKSWLKDHVPEYMVPGEFVEKSSLPLTANGKVNASALTIPERSAFPKPIIGTGKLSPTQKILRQFWIKILGIAPTSIRESFLNSGGHSMSAINFIFNIRSRFNIEIPFCVFEEHDSIEQLAKWIDEKSMPNSTRKLQHFKIKPVKVTARNELSPKWSAGYEKMILKPTNAMSITRGFVLEGSLNRRCLQQAINHLIGIHERLRTKATQENKKLYEDTLPELELKLKFKDLSKLGPIKALKEAEAIFEKRSLIGFDMNQLPLMDLQLLRLKSKKHVLVFAIHHSVADGTSLELLLNQLGQTYSELCREELPTAKAPPCGFREYNKAFADWFKGSSKRRLNAFWKKETAELRSYKFPFERKHVTREEVKLSIIRNYRFQRDWAKQISEFCMSQGISKYVFLVANVHLLMYRYLNQSLVFNSVPSDTRKTSDEAEIVADMGCATFIKSHLDEELSFEEVCQQVSAKVFAVIENNIVGSRGVAQWLQQDPNSQFRLFNLFNVMSSPETGDSLRLRDIQILPFERKVRPTMTKYNLVLRETETDLELALHYPPNLVVKHGMERMFYNLQLFMSMALENPQKKLGSFPDLRTRKNIQGPLTKSERELCLFDSPFQT